VENAVWHIRAGSAILLVMDEKRFNTDGSAWEKLTMSFQLDSSQIADPHRLNVLSDAIYKLVQGEIEFTASERPCVLHRTHVWRDASFNIDEENRMNVDVYLCCANFSKDMAPSMPKIEAFIKRKLQL
jgi:hypothetical protein